MNMSIIFPVAIVSLLLNFISTMHLKADRDDATKCISLINLKKSNEKNQSDLVSKIIWNAMECKKKQSIEFDQCRPLWFGEESEDISPDVIHKCKCFLACLTTGIGWMDDGVFQWGEVNKILNYFQDDKCRSTAEDVLNQCRQKVQGKDCEAAYEMLTCVNDFRKYLTES